MTANVSGIAEGGKQIAPGFRGTCSAAFGNTLLAVRGGFNALNVNNGIKTGYNHESKKTTLHPP
jgi:hypothetical protein